MPINAKIKGFYFICFLGVETKPKPPSSYDVLQDSCLPLKRFLPQLSFTHSREGERKRRKCQNRITNLIKTVDMEVIS